MTRPIVKCGGRRALLLSTAPTSSMPKSVYYVESESAFGLLASTSFFGNTGHAIKKCGVPTIFDQIKMNLVKPKKIVKTRHFNL